MSCSSSISGFVKGLPNTPIRIELVNENDDVMSVVTKDGNFCFSNLKTNSQNTFFLFVYEDSVPHIGNINLVKKIKLKKHQNKFVNLVYQK